MYKIFLELDQGFRRYRTNRNSVNVTFSSDRYLGAGQLSPSLCMLSP